jgi:hypothetical protein
MAIFTILASILTLSAAPLSPTSATVMPDGRVVRVVFSGPVLPGSHGAPDWRPGVLTGAALGIDNGPRLEHLGDVATVDGGNLTWTATYLAPAPITIGERVALTAPPGLLQDGKGTETAALIHLPAINKSLVDADGFTSRGFRRGAGGMTLYVSSRFGDDNRSIVQAQDPKTPLKSLRRALGQAFFGGQHAKGAAIRLLRGDTFDATDAIRIAGQDRLHPFILEDYWHAYRRGDKDPGTRPVVAIRQDAKTPKALISYGGGQTPNPLDHVLIRRIEFRGFGWTVEKGEHNGLVFLQPGSNWTLDDVVIANFAPNLVFQAPSPGKIADVTILRSMSVDSNSGQGIFTDGIRDLLVSQCVFDNNGHSGDSNDPTNRPGGSIFNHNLYIAVRNTPAVVWGSVIANGASNGVQLRCGGILAYNYFGGNAIAAFVGSPGGSQFKNVVEASRDIDAKNPRGFGLSANSGAPPQTTISQMIEDNILVNFAGRMNNAISVEIHKETSIKSTTVRNNTAILAGSFGLSNDMKFDGSTSVEFSRNIFSVGKDRLLNGPSPPTWSWYHADDNVFWAGPGSGSSIQGGNWRLDLLKSKVPFDRRSLVVEPKFADPGSVMSAQSGGHSIRDFLVARRGRRPGTWTPQDDVINLYTAYARALRPTNLPALGKGLFDYYGAVDYRPR